MLDWKIYIYKSESHPHRSKAGGLPPLIFAPSRPLVNSTSLRRGGTLEGNMQNFPPLGAPFFFSHLDRRRKKVYGHDQLLLVAPEKCPKRPLARFPHITTLPTSLKGICVWSKSVVLREVLGPNADLRDRLKAGANKHLIPILLPKI